MRALTIIAKNRVNAAGGRIRTMYAVDLAWLHSYTSQIAGTKTVKAAVNKLNKINSDRYACCYRQYCSYDIVGKIKSANLKAGDEVTTYDTDYETLVKEFEAKFDVKLAV